MTRVWNAVGHQSGGSHHRYVVYRILKVCCMLAYFKKITEFSMECSIQRLPAYIFQPSGTGLWQTKVLNFILGGVQ